MGTRPEKSCLVWVENATMIFEDIPLFILGAADYSIASRPHNVPECGHSALVGDMARELGDDEVDAAL